MRCCRRSAGRPALNLAVELVRGGRARSLDVELIGADVDAIRRAEDRRALPGHDAGRRAARPGERRSSSSVDELDGVPLPGDRAARVHARRHGRRPRAHARGAAPPGPRRGPRGEPERAGARRALLAGWQEFELEVMSDAAGNCVVVCSIENIDPMGVHTGDSWTVAPQQTLPDAEYQRLREAAFACARAVGVATGGANVQFAYEPGTGELRADRDEPARLQVVRARVEGDRLSDRQARRAARRRLHARRAAERHHRPDDGRVRAGPGLRRGQGAALRLREVPRLASGCSAARCAPSARRSASAARSRRRS